MSSSPLDIIQNASIVITVNTAGEPILQDGRYISGPSTRYLMQCYLYRTQATSRATGIGFSSDFKDDIKDGANLSTHTYKGYIIRYGSISNEFQHGVSNEGIINYQDVIDSNGNISSGFPNNNLRSINDTTLRLGEYGVINCRIINLGGVYGSSGIDRTLYSELKGVPISVIGSQVY